jgi:hypothetical protein
MTVLLNHTNVVNFIFLFCWVAKEVKGSLEDGTAGWAEGDDGHAAKNNYLNTQADCTLLNSCALQQQQHHGARIE